MKPLPHLLSLLVFCGACATVAPKPVDPQRRADTAKVIRQGMDLGREPGVGGPEFTRRLEDASLAWLLFRGPAPEAGARRLLDLRQRQPDQALAAVFCDGAGATELAQVLQSEAFRNGVFFNSYDSALFRPFFREALLGYLQDPGREAGLGSDWLQPLELAVKLTPRFAGSYPVQLSPETRDAFQAYVTAHPQGQASERFQMLLALDERAGAWATQRGRAEARLRRLAADSHDELLKLEIDDAMAAPLAKPERAFWMSLLLPGLGQAANGDLEGGLLLGGLTAAAWVWAGSRLAQGQQSGDAGAQGVAYGDAALGAGLALLGHAFTALNASEQAHSVNVVVTWDGLSKDRLKLEH